MGRSEKGAPFRGNCVSSNLFQVSRDGAEARELWPRFPLYCKEPIKSHKCACPLGLFKLLFNTSERQQN